TPAWTRDVRYVRSRPRGSSAPFECGAHALLGFRRAPDRHQVLAEVPALVISEVERAVTHHTLRGGVDRGRVRRQHREAFSGAGDGIFGDLVEQAQSE